MVVVSSLPVLGPAAVDYWPLIAPIKTGFCEKVHVLDPMEYKTIQSLCLMISTQSKLALLVK